MVGSGYGGATLPSYGGGAAGYNASGYSGYSGGGAGGSYGGYSGETASSYDVAYTTPPDNSKARRGRRGGSSIVSTIVMYLQSPLTWMGLMCFVFLYSTLHYRGKHAKILTTIGGRSHSHAISKFQRYKEERDRYRKEAREKRKDFSELEETLNEKHSNVEELLGYLEQKDAQIERLIQAREDHHQGFTELEETLNQKHEDIDELVELLQGREDKVTEMKMWNKKLTDENEQYKADLRACRAKNAR